MKLIVLAGGKGTRLGIADKPKAMVPLAGRPLLEWQLLLARRYGVTDVMLLTGHLGEMIEDYFGDGSAFGVRISYYREKEPLGTAGAFPAVRDWIGADRVLVFYGDVVMDFDVGHFVRFDEADPSSLGTLLVHPNDHPYDSDLLDMDDDGRVTAFYPKPRPEGAFHRNLVNAAVYRLAPGILRYVEPDRPADWGRDIFSRVLAAGGHLRAYVTPEYVKDMGTKDRLVSVESAWISGKVARLNRANPRRAVFLDRDGVINRDVDNLRRVEDMELLPGAAEAIRRINRGERLCVVVTNQPVLAKGWLSADGLRRIHDKMETLLGREGAFVDAIFHCPHHPDRGFPGEVTELKLDCECRKPKAGMLLAARDRLHIQLAESAMIGDSPRDVEAGRAAGLRDCVLIPSNRDYALRDAVTRLLEGEA